MSCQWNYICVKSLDIVISKLVRGIFTYFYKYDFLMIKHDLALNTKRNLRRIVKVLRRKDKNLLILKLVLRKYIVL